MENHTLKIHQWFIAQAHSQTWIKWGKTSELYIKDDKIMATYRWKNLCVTLLLDRDNITITRTVS